MFVGYRVGSRLPGLSDSGGRPRCLLSVRVLDWTCTRLQWRQRRLVASTHVRRLLVEAAWHHRKRYRVGATIQGRWQRAPAAARARGHLGNQRLNQRWKTFTAHHKRPVVANVAIARELAGWCWSLAILPD